VSSPAFGLYGRGDAGRKLSTLVRHLRKKQDFSQEEFTFRTESHRTYVGDIERSGNDATLVIGDEGLDYSVYRND